MLIRKLEFNDYEKYIILINEFRPSIFTEIQFIDTLTYIKLSGDVWVIEDNSQLLATGTIIYEKKMIFNICKYAHLEDICVSEKFRGKGYGKMIVNKLKYESIKNGCHKITLDCNDSNLDFYVKCGFSKRGNQMTELVSNLKR
jgi:glucosamine-phosphate N-acetyltransferase